MTGVNKLGSFLALKALNQPPVLAVRVAVGERDRFAGQGVRLGLGRGSGCVVEGSIELYPVGGTAGLDVVEDAGHVTDDVRGLGGSPEVVLEPQSHELAIDQDGQSIQHASPPPKPPRK